MTVWRKLGLAGIALVAVAALHAAAWFYLADRFERGIDRWAAERRAEGWVVEYSTVTTTGYPIAWRARVAAPRLVRRQGEPAFFWEGPSLDLLWAPWRASTVGFRSAGKHRLGYGPGAAAAPARLEMADAQGRLEFGDGGRLRTLSLRIDDATVAPPADEQIRFNRLNLTLDTDTAPAKPDPAGKDNHLAPSLRIDGALYGLTLPETPRPALGRTIGLIGIRGMVLGAIPADEPREALDRWRRDGGTVEIERLELGWSALTVHADGTLALDAGLQPIGAMKARITGYGETADALVAAGLIKPGEALVAKFALGALAKPSAEGGKPQIEVPLAAQDGFLYVGPVKLIPLPPVRWE